MGSTFYALPCRNGGESFLLRTADRRGSPRAILVDAAFRKGTDGCTIFDVLQAEAPDLACIDVAICTHEDDDHCGGFPGLLRQWTGADKRIGEIWLPGRWAMAFPDAVLRPEWSEQRIVEGAFVAGSKLERADIRTPVEDAQAVDAAIPEYDLPWPFPPYRPLRRRLDQTLVDEHDAPLLRLREGGMDAADWSGVGANAHHVRLARAIEEFLQPRRRIRDYSRRVRKISRSFDSSVPRPISHFGQAMASMIARSGLQIHDRILDIAATALGSRIPVRWFDYGEFARTGVPGGGDPTFLEPVNAVEVIRTSARPSPESLALALRLSTANVESLVFLRCGGHGEPPVLFTADSRLADGTYSTKTDFPCPVPSGVDWPDPVVTAPHHGSKTNEHAYGVLERWFAPHRPIYVRNGGKHVRRGYAPSLLAADARMCVKCGHGDEPRRLIRLEARNGEWQMPVHPVVCVCA